MDEILEFCKEAYEQEYRIRRLSYDYETSEDDFDKQSEDFQEKYFHSSMSDSRLSRQVFDFDDESDRELMASTASKLTERKVLKLIKFKNPTIGSALKMGVPRNEIFVAQTSAEDVSENGLTFDSADYIANTDEGLKIIYQKSFGRDSGWRHSHDLEVSRVNEDGEAVEIRRIEAPDREFDKQDYES